MAKVGDKGLMVWPDNGRPRLCRLECVHVSPKGRSERWRFLDLESQPEMKLTDVARTPADAVRQYQISILYEAVHLGFMTPERSLEDSLDLILAAEDLLQDSMTIQFDAYPRRNSKE